MTSFIIKIDNTYRFLGVQCPPHTGRAMGDHGESFFGKWAVDRGRTATRALPCRSLEPWRRSTTIVVRWSFGMVRIGWSTSRAVTMSMWEMMRAELARSPVASAYPPAAILTPEALAGPAA